MITDNGLFTHIAYDMTNLEGFNKLVAEGYMATLVPRRTKTELDVSNVGIIKGEFVATQLQGAVDKAEITYKALEEAIHAGHDRKSWLIFASGIDHAEHIAEQLKAFGIACEPVHSKRNDAENDKAIAAFKSGELRAIVNYGKLTTGFNHPEIDLILMLRPTMSVPLWVQMLGRGTRPAPGKKNCLVLDFARNTPRLGPINDPAIPKKKGEAAGELPVKICEGCGTYNHISARVCSECGEPFSFQVKITSRAGSDELIRNKPVFKTQIERFKVDYDIYAKHTKVGRPPSLRVTYFVNGIMFREYICLEHQGMAKKVAREWWRKRSIVEPPNTIDEALKLTGDLRKPRFISVDVAAAYPTIIGAEF
jgi:DNA repair protein RadD